AQQSAGQAGQEPGGQAAPSRGNGLRPVRAAVSGAGGGEGDCDGSGRGGTAMTEDEWITCNHPNSMFELLQDEVSTRKRRLFGVACCRTLWSWITNDITRQAIDAAERYADGLLSHEELYRACAAHYTDVEGRATAPWLGSSLGQAVLYAALLNQEEYSNLTGR